MHPKTTCFIVFRAFARLKIAASGVFWGTDFGVFLLLGWVVQGAHALKVNYKTVEVRGTGDTRSDAIQWAQINAIQLVTGSNYSVSQTLESSLSSTDGVSKTGTSSNIDISKETAGIIRSSKIKSAIYNEHLSEWNAVLSVTVLDLDRSTGRKSISVSTLRADKRALEKFAGYLTSNIKSQYWNRLICNRVF